MEGRRRVLLFVAFGVAAVVATYLVVDRVSRTPEPDTSAYCEQIGAIADLDEALGNLDLAAVQAALPELEDLELSAPADIRSQIETLRTTVQQLEQAMAAAPSGDTAALEEVWRQHEADLSTIVTASAAVVDYTATTCGVDLNRGNTPGTTLGTASTAGTATTVAGGP